MRKPGRTAVTAAALMIGVAMVVVRHRLRRRHHQLDQRRDRPQLPGRHVRAEHRRLLADPGVDRARGVARAGRRARCPRSASATRQGAAACAARERVAGVEPGHASPTCSRSSGRTARRRDRLAAGRTRRWWTTRGRSPTTSRWATRCAPLGPDRQARALRGGGQRQGQRRLPRQLRDHPVPAAQRLRRAARHLRARRRGERRRRRRGPEPDREPAQGALSRRRRRSTRSSSRSDQEAQLQPLLALVYGLLSLAVLVSIFGIVNTLALSIHERTRELGMLRAIGMSRRQLKRMIRYESVITALIGAILGTVLGRDLRRRGLAPAGRRGLRALLSRSSTCS